MEDKLLKLNQLQQDFMVLSNEIYFLNNLIKLKQQQLNLIKNSTLISKDTKDSLENIIKDYFQKIEQISQNSKSASKELSKQIVKLTK
ncbi:hypothetical protein [Mycoplasmopsis glycophila]|uniref:Uncharacterized protein n=1 Tax=Mycoplasmopsis glycophila TaxID=171285 RepID=A0A449AVN7_9BACT|nr:hypothetical protein [Mycoplasmopsis glycophila]VEU70327.1 Uncharacterised protein [Mycoplasmopsis glycophila]VEU70666.1 Uncharacterised protein [Mycoplasmopsis glycophila]